MPISPMTIDCLMLVMTNDDWQYYTYYVHCRLLIIIDNWLVMMTGNDQLLITIAEEDDWQFMTNNNKTRQLKVFSTLASSSSVKF